MIDDKRKVALLTVLRIGPSTSREIARRIGLEKGSQISSQIASLRYDGLIEVCATRRERQMILLVYKLTHSGQKASDRVRQSCPDDGTCHHNCLAGQCFRVHHAGPLSRGEGDWTEAEINDYSDPPSVEAIFDA